MLVYTADHVFPVSGPPLRDGAVAVAAGRIVAVGPRETVSAAAGSGARIEALGPVALIPGLVNAHCHLELSWMAADRPPGGDYTAWVRGLLSRREGADPTLAHDAAEREIERMLSRGVVALGDVGNEPWVAPLLARSTLRGVFFYEVLGLGSGQAEGIVAEAIAHLEVVHGDPDVIAAGSRWRIALTPHAPHTTSAALLRALAGRATASGTPLSIHLAESEAELAFLLDRDGPLVELFGEREFLDDAWEPPGLGPVQYVDRLGALGPQTLAVHCVHLSREDHSRLQARGSTVVTCARSNEYLGVGAAPVPLLLAEGIPVAVGTDSLASAPDVDVLGEMERLRATHGSLSPAAVLRMATLNGARALGLDAQLGSLEPGKQARMVAIGVGDRADDPLELVCSNPTDVTALHPEHEP
jgi:cytosine/adenosine deaminase-related metal-dependent hydrolase